MWSVWKREGKVGKTGVVLMRRNGGNPSERGKSNLETSGEEKEGDDSPLSS